MKEYMLEVQVLLIRRLATKDNHLKGLVEALKPSNINFNERVKEVEEVIRAL